MSTTCQGLALSAYEDLLPGGSRWTATLTNDQGTVVHASRPHLTKAAAVTDVKDQAVAWLRGETATTDQKGA